MFIGISEASQSRMYNILNDILARFKGGHASQDVLLEFVNVREGSVEYISQVPFTE